LKLKFISIGIIATLILACNKKNQEVKTESVFPVTEVIAIDTFIYTDYVAEINALQNVEIRARVAGYLEKIYVDEGAYVKEGQLLFSINKKEYSEELAKARALLKIAAAEVSAAQLDYQNAQSLFKKKIISSTEAEISKNKLEAQQARMEEAEAHQAHAQLKLSNAEIRAPFSGIINRIPHKIGSLIDEGTLLTTISQNEEVYAYFDVSEKEYLNYARKSGKDTNNSSIVSLVLADGIEHKYKGQIETVEGAIDENTGNIAFRARFPNPERIIKHGASGRVRVPKRFDNALVVPQKSTFEIQDRVYVYALDTSNALHMRQIKIQQRLPHLFIISSGLNPGDKILFEGIQTVKDGQTIAPNIVNMTSIINDFKQ
jgi:RND family efflux transporter MFP subunit